MPTCSVTNCWKPAVEFNVGDRLRGSYCEDHQDVSNELQRTGDAEDRRGVESDLGRGDNEDFVIPSAEKSGDVAESSAAKTDPSETVSLKDESTPLGADKSSKSSKSSK